jgi:hypothetical protein
MKLEDGLDYTATKRSSWCAEGERATVSAVSFDQSLVVTYHEDEVGNAGVENIP